MLPPGFQKLMTMFKTFKMVCVSKTHSADISEDANSDGCRVAGKLLEVL